MSIRTRLLLIMLSVLLPGILAALWLVAQAWDGQRSALRKGLADTSRALALVVDRELVRRADIVALLADAAQLDGPEPSPAQLAEFARLARAATRGVAGWIELRSAAGVLVDTRVGATPPAAAPRPAGTTPLSSSAAVLPLMDRPAAPLHARVVAPVRRDGELRFDLSLTLLPQELQTLLDAQQLLPGAIAVVIDSGGKVVARRPGGVHYVGWEATEDLKAHILRTRESAFDSVSLDGRAVSGYFSTSAQGWVYASVLPRSTAAGALRTRAALLLLGTLALIALAVAVTLWQARRIARPVAALPHGFERMLRGEADAAPATGILELDRAGSALARAAALVRRSEAEMARQVADAVRRIRESDQRVAQGQRVEALGRLTGGVAHEFNNLLGIVSNSTHLIQRLNADPRLEAPVAASLRAVDTGSRLVQQLLRFAGRQPLHLRRVHLATYLEEVTVLMKTVLGRRVQVAVQVDPATPTVQLDIAELELALINLALNARDAMPDGGRLLLQAHAADAEERSGLPDGDYVVIHVADEGGGIDDEQAARVFEPFFTTKPVGSASGLGLSQVYGFCQQAGGTARFASTPGLGTTVSLVLPVRGRDAAPAPLPQAPRPVGGGLAGARLLLVEDNEEMRDVTAALLDTEGLQVWRAADAAEALALFDRVGSFDVVLSDIVMPGPMDGVALARTLKRRRPELPVVLISGYSEALGAAQDFPVLRKPCPPGVLLAALHEALRTRHGPGAA